MARENASWGSDPIRGEILELGIAVSKRTIQRYVTVIRDPACGQRWATYPKSRTVWACDYVQACDCWFRPMFAFLIVDVNDKRVVQVGVTRSPSAEWKALQLREAPAFGEGTQGLIRDCDSEFGAAFDRSRAGDQESAIGVVLTRVKTPNPNAVRERFIGCARRGCPDHIPLLGEGHMKLVLSAYALSYIDYACTHQGIEQRVPAKEWRGGSCRVGVRVIESPVSGELSSRLSGRSLMNHGGDHSRVARVVSTAPNNQDSRHKAKRPPL